jgi:IclR helix-turn-helix domain
VSDVLDRIQQEIRERMGAIRSAVHEHERLEAALHALEGAGARAVGARRRTGPAEPSSAAGAQGSKAPSSGPSRSRPADSASAPSAGEVKAPPSTATSAAAPAGGAKTAPRSRPARTKTPAGAAKTAARRPSSAKRRAPRGANRAAVLRVVGERPGVTSRELATASGVTGGTLSALLRTLTQRGELEKRPLPGGQTGYALASSQTPAIASAPDAPGRAPASPSSPAAEGPPSVAVQEAAAGSSQTEPEPSAPAREAETTPSPPQANGD